MLEVFASLFGIFKGLAESLVKLTDWRRSARLSRIAASRQKDAEDLLSRFLQIFEMLEVPRPLIPKFLAAQHLLSVQQACSDQLLPGVMTDALLEHTAKRLAIPTEWFYGTVSTRYRRHWNYKNPIGVLDLLEELLRLSPGTSYDAELLVISNRQVRDQVPADTRLIVLFLQSIDQVEGKEVTWVHVVEDDLPWHHGAARLHAKQTILIAMALGIPIRGRNAEEGLFRSFEQGEVFPYELANSSRGMWHPDDYVVLPAESVVAKESTEALLVRNSLSECGLFERAAGVRVALGRQDVYGLVTPPRALMLGQVKQT